MTKRFWGSVRGPSDQLPGGRAVPRRRVWLAAVRPLSAGAVRPAEPPKQAGQPKASQSELSHNVRRSNGWRAPAQQTCKTPALGA